MCFGYKISKRGIGELGFFFERDREREIGQGREGEIEENGKLKKELG